MCNPGLCVFRFSESADKGGRVNWRKTPVKLFEADLGRNDVQVGRARAGPLGYTGVSYGKSYNFHVSRQSRLVDRDRCTVYCTERVRLQ